MSRFESSRLAFGVILGIMAGAIIWYWQKSTAAEDGALALLDRLAAAEAELHQLRSKLEGQQELTPDASYGG